MEITLGTRDSTVLRIFIKLPIHIHYVQRMIPIGFGGQKSRSLTNMGCVGCYALHWLKRLHYRYFEKPIEHVWQCTYEIDFGQMCIGTDCKKKSAFLLWYKKINSSTEHLQRVGYASRERLPFWTPGSIPLLGTCLCPNC